MRKIGFYSKASKDTVVANGRRSGIAIFRTKLELRLTSKTDTDNWINVTNNFIMMYKLYTIKYFLFTQPNHVFTARKKNSKFTNITIT